MEYLIIALSCFTTTLILGTILHKLFPNEDRGLIIATNIMIGTISGMAIAQGIVKLIQ